VEDPRALSDDDVVEGDLAVFFLLPAKDADDEVRFEEEEGEVERDWSFLLFLLLERERREEEEDEAAGLGDLADGDADGAILF